MTWSFTISLPSQDVRHSGSGFPDPLGACTYRPCSSLSISAVTASSPSTQSREFDQAVSLGWNSLISWLHSHMSPAVWCFRPDQIPSYIGREWWILITWKDLTCENPSGPSSNRINMITDGCVLTEHRVNGFSLCWLSKLNVCNFFNIRCLWFSQVMKILNCPPAFPSACIPIRQRWPLTCTCRTLPDFILYLYTQTHTNKRTYTGVCVLSQTQHSVLSDCFIERHLHCFHCF